MDLVMFLVMLRLPDAAGRSMHLSDFKIALLIGSQSFTYIPACFAAGWMLKRSNARLFLICSLLLTMVVNIPLLFTNSFGVALPMMVLSGMAMAVFFNSAQTFMRGDVPPGSLIRTIGLYNFAWSTGVACGFLFGGLLNNFGGSAALAAFSTATCLLMLGMILAHKSRPLHHDSADGVIEQSLPGDRGVDPRYVIVGWLLAFVMNFTQRPIFAFTPKLYAEKHQPQWKAGVMLFLLVLMQALVALAAPRLRRWFYRRLSLLAMALPLMAGLGLVWLTFPGFWLSLLPMLVVGAIQGLMILASIYYVSNDPRSSRNVGVNEAMVGIAGVSGPILCEWIMELTGYRAAFFPAMIVMTLLVLAAQLILLRRANGHQIEIHGRNGTCRL